MYMFIIPAQRPHRADMTHNFKKKKKRIEFTPTHTFIQIIIVP